MMPADVLRRQVVTDSADARRDPLRVVHCLRAPVGGAFRHVRDLAEAQQAAGHAVGLICDSSTGGDLEAQALQRLEPFLALGIHRFPMRREIALSDFALTARIGRAVKAIHPDVLHAHGSKGGAYARMVGTLLRASGMRVARIYTPHGGSLHFDPRSAKGRVYFNIERALAAMTDAFVFVSQFEADTFAAKVGRTRAPYVIAPNGLKPEEFRPVARASDARDFLFIGELRDLKGPDVFLKALAAIRKASGAPLTAFVVGDGPDKAGYRKLATDLGLDAAVTFLDPMPARTAFRLAHVMVMPSRHESLPYIVLEATAAGMPVVATRVGGIPEIFGADAERLVAPGDPEALAAGMMAAHAAPVRAVQAAIRVQDHVRRTFSIAAMAHTIEDAYGLVAAR